MHERKARDERKKQVAAMEQRILARLDRFIAKYGSKRIDEVLPLTNRRVLPPMDQNPPAAD